MKKKQPRAQNSEKINKNKRSYSDYNLYIYRIKIARIE